MPPPIRPIAHSESTLVGRETELHWLEGHLRQAASGHPRLVLVSGESGLGKSRLASEFAARASREHFWVCWGRAFQDMTFPGLPFADILRDQLADVPEMIERMLGADLERLVAFAKGDATLDGPEEALQTSHGFEGQMGLVVAISRAMIELARARPTVIVIDDLQWADGATLAQLQHLLFDVSDCMHGEPVKLLLVAIHREVEPGSPADRAVTRLRRESLCHTLEVGELNEDEVRSLVVGLGIERPARQLVSAVHAATRGNPLLVQDVVNELIKQHALGERGGHQAMVKTLDDLALPTDLEGAIHSRITAASEACRQAIFFGACLGERFAAGQLATVAGLDEDTVIELLEEATHQRLLWCDGEIFEFHHPLVRHVIYTTASSARRHRIHLRIAETLEKAEEADAFEIAHHLERAGTRASPAKLAEFAQSAGEIAFARLAWGEAARFFEVAARAKRSSGGPAGEIAALDFRAGVSHYRNMDLGPSVEHLDRAIAGYRSAGDLQGVARVLVEWARAQITMASARYGSVIDVAPLEAALDDLPDGDEALRGWLFASLAEAHAAVDPDKATQLANQALELGHRVGDHRLCTHASVTYGMAKTQALELEVALESLEAARGHALQTTDPWVQGWPMQRIPLVLAWQGRLEEAERVASEACQLCSTTQDWAEYSLAVATRALIAVARGDFDGADRWTQESLTMAHRSHYPWGAALALVTQASAWAARGAYAEMHAALDAAVEPGGVFEDAGPALQFLVKIYGELGDARAGLLDTAETLAVRALTAAPPATPDPQILGALCAGAETAVLLGDAELAQRCADQLAVAAERGVVFPNGWLFLLPRVLASVAAMNRRWESAESNFERAIELASAIDARPELGRSHLDYACMLLARGASGDRERAAQEVLSARPLLAQLAMQPHLDAAQHLALELGLPEEEVPLPVADASPAASFAALLLTDMEGFTKLIEREGDGRAQQVVHAHNAMIRACVRAYHGHEVHHTGDGLMASFPTVVGAVHCAIAIQRDLARYNARGSNIPIHVRAACHAGDVRAEEDRLFGSAVVATTRICGLTEADQILVSQAVCEQMPGEGAVLHDRGNVALKGFAERFRVYDVSWGEPEKE